MELSLTITPPQEPLPSDCCGSGCVPCVFDLYEEELKRYEYELAVTKNGRMEKSSLDSGDNILQPPSQHVLDLVPDDPPLNRGVQELWTGFPHLPLEERLSKYHTRYEKCRIATVSATTCVGETSYTKRKNQFSLHDAKGREEDEVVTRRSMMVEMLLPRYSGIHYLPGDVFGILPPNSYHDINQIVERLRSGKGSVSFGEAVSYRWTGGENEGQQEWQRSLVGVVMSVEEALGWVWDLRRMPSLALLREILATQCSSGEEKERISFLLSAAGKEMYSFMCEIRITLCEFLKLFPKITLTLAMLSQNLPPMSPRFYSVTNSPFPLQERVRLFYSYSTSTTLAGGIVKKASDIRTQLNGRSDSSSLLTLLDNTVHIVKNRDKVGLVASVFESGHQGILYKEIEKEKNSVSSFPLRLPVIHSSRYSFNLPEDDDVPMILISSGTGLAPYLSFLDHRMVMKERKKSQKHEDISLFHVYRHSLADPLFSDILLPFLLTGVVSDLHLCLALDQKDGDISSNSLVTLGRDMYDQLFLTSKGDEIMSGKRDQLLASLQSTLRARLTEAFPNIFEALNRRRGVVYICGSGYFARAVTNIFEEGIMREIGKACKEASGAGTKRRYESNANDVIANWVRKKQFFCDSWA